MELFYIGLEPGSQRPSKDNALGVGEKHLRRAAGVSNIFAFGLLFVDEANVTNIRSHAGELPGASTALVIRTRGEFPSQRRRVFHSSLGRLLVCLQEFMGRE